MDPEKAEAYHIRGTARFLANQDVAALHDLSEAIGLGPSMSDAYYIRALVRAKRSDFQKAMGDHERAIADYNEAICLEPDKAARWIDLADVYQYRGNFQDAMSCYNQAIRLEPASRYAVLAWLRCSGKPASAR